MRRRVKPLRVSRTRSVRSGEPATALSPLRGCWSVKEPPRQWRRRPNGLGSRGRPPTATSRTSDPCWSRPTRRPLPQPCFPDGASADPRERLDAVATRFIRLILDTEAAQRTMLRLSLDPDPLARGGLPLRQGRAIAWISEALQPLRGHLTDEEVHRLALAVRSAIGVEALVWLTDIGGLSREDAAETMRWSAQSLLSAVLNESPPPTRVRRRRARKPGSRTP